MISFAETVKEMQWDVMLASQTAGFSENLFRRGKEAVEGLYLSTYYVPKGQGDRFVSEFAREFGGREPSHREVNAYDALELAVKALDQVGPDRAKLLQYLASVGDQEPPYDGVSGTFALAKNMDARKPVLLKVVDGSYQVIDN